MEEFRRKNRSGEGKKGMSFKTGCKVKEVPDNP